MFNWKRRCIGCRGMGVLAVVLLAAVPQASKGQSGPAALDQAGWERLASELGSGDGGARVQAQKTLDQIPLGQRDALRKLAAATQSAEARARLLARVDALTELELTDPPKIALDLKDADAEQLAAALGKATGVPLRVGEWKELASARFTAKGEMSFWECLRQLGEGHPISLGLYADGWTLRPDPYPKMQTVRVRGFQVRAGELEWDAKGERIFVTTRPAAPTIVPKVVGSLELGIDPRIPVAQVGVPVLTRYVDDQENGWIDHTMGVEESALVHQSMFLQSIALEPWNKRGTALTIAGKWPVDLLLEAIHAEVKDLSGPPAKPIELGDVEIGVTRLEVSPMVEGTCSMQFRCEITRHSATLGPAMAVGISVLGRDGKLLRSLATQSRGGSLAAGVDRLPEAPAKIVFTLPTRTLRCWIPFEFKNLPIDFNPPVRAHTW